MQSLALAWLVLELTGSGTALGAVMATRFVPTLFLAPIGGVIADRFEKRRLIIGTQEHRRPACLGSWADHVERRNRTVDGLRHLRSVRCGHGARQSQPSDLCDGDGGSGGSEQCGNAQQRGCQRCSGHWPCAWWNRHRDLRNRRVLPDQRRELSSCAHCNGSDPQGRAAPLKTSRTSTPSTARRPSVRARRRDPADDAPDARRDWHTDIRVLNNAAVARRVHVRRRRNRACDHDLADGCGGGDRRARCRLDRTSDASSDSLRWPRSSASPSGLLHSCPPSNSFTP